MTINCVVKKTKKTKKQTKKNKKKKDKTKKEISNHHATKNLVKTNIKHI